MSKLLSDYLESDPIDISPTDLIDFFCKMNCNNFNVSDEEMRYVGVG